MVWKLIWKDSLRFDRSINSSVTLLPLVYSTYMNMFLLRSDNSFYEFVFGIYFLIVLVVSTVFPVKLARGLYLCPLTEGERKKYLVTACYLRVGVMMSLLGVFLIVSKLFLEADYRILLMQFIWMTIVILGIVYLCLLSGTNSLEMARQRYYTAQNITAPKILKESRLEQKTVVYSNLLLIIALVLGILGVILPMRYKEINIYLWIYYISSFTVSVVCIIVYLRKYFDEIITFSANRESFYYQKKRTGGFHAD